MRYNEDKILQEVISYIKSTYNQHYSDSGSGFQNNAPVISTTSNDTIYLRFKLVEVKANSGNLSAEDRTITFTNNGVSNTDLQINCQIAAGGGGGLQP